MVRSLIRVHLPSLLAIALAQVAWAQPMPVIIECTKHHGMVGIAFNETLRVNIVAGKSGGLVISIFDPQGNLQDTISINYTKGKISFVQQNGNDTVRRFGERAERRVAITPQDPLSSPCPLLASLEVFDNITGVTSVIVPLLPVAPPGPNEFIFGPVGATALKPRA